MTMVGSLTAQGNRVKLSRGDEACQEIVIPGGNLTPQAQGVLVEIDEQWTASTQPYLKWNANPTSRA